MGRKRYPQEYIDRLVELARSDRSVASLAEEFVPTPQSIHWGILMSFSGEFRCRLTPVDRDDSKELRKLRRELARSMIFDYLEGFYNMRRLHSSLGYLSPMEFERRHARAN